MLAKIDKRALVTALCEQLGETQRTIEQAAAAAHEGATHEQAKPENDKDTRALEASYLAGAQAARARELKAVQNALAFLPLKKHDTVAEAALVHVKAGARSNVYFIAVHGGGLKAKVNGVEITVITPDAPLGQALLEGAAGDEVMFNGRTLTIVEVS